MESNLNPNDIFYSEVIEVSGLNDNEKQQIKSNVPIEVRINSGEWIKVFPSNIE